MLLLRGPNLELNGLTGSTLRALDCILVERDDRNLEGISWLGVGIPNVERCRAAKKTLSIQSLGQDSQGFSPRKVLNQQFHFR